MMPEFQKEKHIAITKHTFEMLVNNVMEEYRPYLKNDAELKEISIKTYRPV